MNCEHSKRTCGPLIPLAALLFASVAVAQQSSGNAAMAPNGGETAHLEQRLDQVLTALDGMRHQLDDSQHEIEQLRAELHEVRAQLAESHTAEPTQAASDLNSAVQQLQDQNEVLQAEVKQHEQTKLESASKYPLRISGMLLFSSFLNHGAVDNIDLPILAVPKSDTTGNGSLSATARQTILSLDATGPRLWGAHSSADLSVDFFGGVPYADYTTSSGILRLRTAHASLDWDRNSLTASLDKPLISPLNPTSFVSVGEPAMAWSGNLWSWSPQLAWKNRETVPGGKLGIEFGLIDPAAPGPPLNNGLRQPDASEKSRQPGYESRLSYTIPFGDRPLEIGAGGYYSRQSYGYGQHIDAWAGTADWRIPFDKYLELSGEFYRGRAIGGLGGGAFKDYVQYANSYRYQGLDAEGGWAQFKVRMMRSLEANLAIGQDNAFAGDLHGSSDASLTDNYSNLARNRTTLGNVIFRPKTYLLFSAEYRNIHSWPITGSANTSQSLGLAAGYLF